MPYIATIITGSVPPKGYIEGTNAIITVGPFWYARTSDHAPFVQIDAVLAAHLIQTFRNVQVIESERALDVK